MYRKSSLLTIGFRAKSRVKTRSECLSVKVTQPKPGSYGSPHKPLICRVVRFLFGVLTATPDFTESLACRSHSVIRHETFSRHALNVFFLGLGSTRTVKESFTSSSYAVAYLKDSMRRVYLRIYVCYRLSLIILQSLFVYFCHGHYKNILRFKNNTN